MAQVRVLKVRLNRGEVRIRYRIEVRAPLQLLCGWWIDGQPEQAKSGLSVVERLIIGALVYADAR